MKAESFVPVSIYLAQIPVIIFREQPRMLPPKSIALTANYLKIDTKILLKADSIIRAIKGET